MTSAVRSVRQTGADGTTPFVAELEAANLHPLWDRFRTITPVEAAGEGPAVHLALVATSSRSPLARSARCRSTTSSGAR